MATVARFLEFLVDSLKKRLPGGPAARAVLEPELPDHEWLAALATDPDSVPMPGPLALIVMNIGAVFPDSGDFVEKAGESLMADAVATVRTTLRPGDLLFRFGPDRVAVVLMRTGREPAEAVAAALTARLRGTDAGPDGEVIATSTTVLATPLDGAGLSDLLARAAVADPFPFGTNSVDFLAAVS